MKIYLATWIFEVNQQESLNKQKNKTRLMSYYHLSDPKAKLTLEDYFNNETILSKLQRPRKELRRSR